MTTEFRVEGLDDLRAKVKALKEQFIPKAEQVFAKSIQDIILEEVQEAFSNREDPNTHSQWKPLSKRYKTQGRSSGQLSRSIQTEVKTDKAGTVIEISSISPYAVFQNYGTTKIPARPFMPTALTPKQVDQVRQTLVQLFQDHFR